MTTHTKVKLRPLADRVLVKRAKHEERTTGGIILPETNREKQEMGVVIAIGPGKTDKDGRRIEITVKAGDKIMWDKFAGSEVKIEDEDDFVIVKSDDIIAIVE
jgi:chaperonin GroES